MFAIAHRCFCNILYLWKITREFERIVNIHWPRTITPSKQGASCSWTKTYSVFPRETFLKGPFMQSSATVTSELASYQKLSAISSNLSITGSCDENIICVVALHSTLVCVSMVGSVGRICTMSDVHYCITVINFRSAIDSNGLPVDGPVKTSGH